MADPIPPLPGIPKFADYLASARGDVSFAHALMDRDAQIKASAPNPAGDYTPRGDGNWLTAGLGAGFHEAAGQVGSFGEALSQKLGLANAAEASRRFGEGQRQAAAGYERPDLENAPWYQPSKLGYTVAKGGAATAAILGAGLIGAGAAPEGMAAVGGGLAGALASYPFAVGGNVQAAEDYNLRHNREQGSGGFAQSAITPGQSSAALALGVPEAAIGGIPAERFASMALPGLAGAMKQRIVKGAVEQGGIGAAAGAAQDALTQLMGDPNRTMADRAHEVIQSAIGGGVQGAAFGGAMGAVRPGAEIAKTPVSDVSNDALKAATGSALGIPSQEPMLALPPPGAGREARLEPPQRFPQTAEPLPGQEPGDVVTPPAESGQAIRQIQDPRFFAGDRLNDVGEQVNRPLSGEAIPLPGPAAIDGEGPARPFEDLSNEALLAQARALRGNGRNPERLASVIDEMRFRAGMNDLASTPAATPALEVPAEMPEGPKPAAPADQPEAPKLVALSDAKPGDAVQDGVLVQKGLRKQDATKLAKEQGEGAQVVNDGKKWAVVKAAEAPPAEPVAPAETPAAEPAPIPTAAQEAAVAPAQAAQEPAPPVEPESPGEAPKSGFQSLGDLNVAAAKSGDYNGFLRENADAFNAAISAAKGERAAGTMGAGARSGRSYVDGVESALQRAQAEAPAELPAKASDNPARTPLDQEVAAKVSAGASAQDIFSHIAQNHPDADMRAVADALRKSGVNPSVKWLDKVTDADLASKIKPEDVTGLYSKTQNRIGLLTGDDATRTMLHEGVHAATANAIDGNTTAAVAIKKIYATLKARSPNDDAYGLTNPHEFVAEAMTNPQFRDFLKGETSASGSAAKDMWQTFKNVVFKALRMPERARNAFDQVMEHMPGLMDENATAGRPPVAPGDELPAMAQKHDDAVREGVNFAQGALDRFAERGGVSGVASRAKMALQGTLNQALHNASLIHNAPEMPTVKGYFDTVMKGTNYQHVQDKVRAKLDQAHDFFRGDKTLKRSIDNFALGTNRGINGMEPIDQLAHLAPDDVADKAGWIRSSKDPKAVAWRQAHDDAQKAFNEINKTPEGRDALAKMIAGTRFGPRAAHIAAMDNAVRMNPLLKTLLEDNPAFKGDFFGDFQNRTDAHDNTILANDLAGQTLRAKTTALSGVLDQLKDWKGFLKPKGEAFKKQWEAYGDAKDDFDRLRKIVDGITGSEAAQDKVPNFAVGRQGDWAVAGRIAGQDGKLSEANSDKLRDRLSAEGFDNAVIDYMTGNPDVYIRTETKEQAARLGNVFRQAAKDGVLNADKASGGKPIFEGPRKSGMDWQGIPLSELHKFGQLMAGAMPERPAGMSDEEWRPLANAHEQAQSDFARQYLDMLPDTSLTKIFVKRKMVQGYAPDVLTANSQRAANMARGVANLAIAPERATALSAINKQLNGIMHSDLPVERKEALNQIVQELAAREKARQSNTANTAIDAVRSVTHVAGIGLSVPYFLLLQSQLLTLVHPELGKIFGHVDAAKSMMSATPKALEIIKQVLSDPNARRTMQLRAETLKPNGRLSQADIDNILREDNRGGFNNSGFTSTDTGGNFSQGFKHAIELGSMMSMYSEQIPKLITFLAGHDLATKSPGKVPKNLSAEEYAHYANDQANMAFGAGTTPRLFGAAGPAGQVGKLMAQFMSFSSQLGQKIYREVDDSFGKARPGETEAQAQLRRSQGRNWLGSHAAATAVLAGSLGLPGPSFAMGIFDKLADWATGEDSWDVQTQYRNWLSNTFGQKAGEIIARGAPRALGVDMSKSGEGELPDRLMPFMQLLTEKRKFEDAWPDFLKHMAGPATGLGVRTVLGARDMLNGDFLKGAIKVLPELFKAPLEAAQIAQLGGYPNNKGVVDPRLHPGPLEIGEAALGVDTAGQAEASETNKVKAGLDAMRLYHSHNILQHLALAHMRNDPESAQQWMAANQDYVQEHPGMRPPVAGLRTYLQEQMRNEAISRQTGLPAGVHPRDLATRQALSFGNFVGR